MSERKGPEPFLLPEGRLINHSLFVKDAFDDAATPGYKVELAFDPDDLPDVEDALAAAAVEKWGAGSDEDYWEERILSPIIDGNELARRREEKKKPGDSYKGKQVIRAHTIFNIHGADGPGGVQVLGPDKTPIEAIMSHEVYPGCYGQAVVKIGNYVESKTQKRALMFYLCAFQKTKDGEPLVSASDYTELFRPVGRDTAEGAAATGGRRRRKG